MGIAGIDHDFQPFLLNDKNSNKVDAVGEFQSHYFNSITLYWSKDFLDTYWYILQTIVNNSLAYTVSYDPCYFDPFPQLQSLATT